MSHAMPRALARIRATLSFDVTIYAPIEPAIKITLGFIPRYPTEAVQDEWAGRFGRLILAAIRLDPIPERLVQYLVIVTSPGEYVDDIEAEFGRTAAPTYDDVRSAIWALAPADQEALVDLHTEGYFDDDFGRVLIDIADSWYRTLRIDGVERS